jgi:hypothetical protein
MSVDDEHDQTHELACVWVNTRSTGSDSGEGLQNNRCQRNVHSRTVDAVAAASLNGRASGESVCTVQVQVQRCGRFLVSDISCTRNLLK